MVTVAEPVQPLASVAVTVYVPAHSPVATAPLPPLGAQEKLYPGEPPVALAKALPVQLLLQDTLVIILAETTTCVGWVIVKL